MQVLAPLSLAWVPEGSLPGFHCPRGKRASSLALFELDGLFLESAEVDGVVEG